MSDHQETATTTTTATSPTTTSTTNSVKMTPAMEAAELLGELFPEAPRRVVQREWPVMEAAPVGKDRHTRVPSALQRRDPKLAYLLCITAVAIFAVIVIGVAMIRRAPEKQVTHGYPQRATPRVQEAETETYIQAFKSVGRRLGIFGVIDVYSRHLPVKKPNKEDEESQASAAALRHDQVGPDAVQEATDFVGRGAGPKRRNAERRLPKNSLICVVGEGYSRESMVFPPDGLCTIVFFNSLLTRNQLSPPFQDDLVYFMETARSHKRTEYGVGFDYE
ncbi:hypothetical protein HPB50_004564 [Hyalomma asiaticum]|uniref:Uncharacterized protein n=1 Tax=Hyalomma asiaticum TaxID=266040 RepID=A0ACB7RL63_HYAAI|nr:hypothetical protein HPB50_004564 [Hyalomma asiaticum]